MGDRIIGREQELAEIHRAVAAIRVGPMACLIDGDVGIGKTTLWRDGVRVAEQGGVRVLVARAAESESRLAFGALIDLLTSYLDETLPHLAEPQAKALQVALLREAPDEIPDQRTVSVAALSALRVLARAGPVLVAVEDVHWMDRPSARVLAYAMRRLDHEPIGVLATLRFERQLGDPLDLSALEEGRLTRVRLAPLSLVAVHELVLSRFGCSLRQPALARLQRATGGNPLFVLEIMRSVVPGTSMIRGCWRLRFLVAYRTRWRAGCSG